MHNVLVHDVQAACPHCQEQNSGYRFIRWIYLCVSLVWRFFARCRHRRAAQCACATDRPCGCNAARMRYGACLPNFRHQFFPKLCRLKYFLIFYPFMAVSTFRSKQVGVWFLTFSHLFSWVGAFAHASWPFWVAARSFERLSRSSARLLFLHAPSS